MIELCASVRFETALSLALGIEFFWDRVSLCQAWLLLWTTPHTEALPVSIVYHTTKEQPKRSCIQLFWNDSKINPNRCKKINLRNMDFFGGQDVPSPPRQKQKSRDLFSEPCFGTRVSLNISKLAKILSPETSKYQRGFSFYLPAYVCFSVSEEGSGLNLTCWLGRAKKP